MSALFDVSGKSVLITGGSRGIGAMIARSFVENGARVMIASRKATDCDDFAAELAESGECLSVPADLSQVGEIERLADAVVDRFGTLDVLVNNAGATWGAPLGQFPEAGWDKTLNINLKAPFFLVQALLPALESSAAGASVINIASVDGLSPPPFDSFAYSASKAGLIMLTRHLAAKLGPRNIRVNAVAPGFFATDMTRGVLGGVETKVIESVPLRRLGKPDDIGGLCVFLASRASSFVHGAVIPCDGGLESCGR
jgi:NAD(P)-dependent dehydrogenase (short-subunit alcohol dehydrogenase family)